MTKKCYPTCQILAKSFFNKFLSSLIFSEQSLCLHTASNHCQKVHNLWESHRNFFYFIIPNLLWGFKLEISVLLFIVVKNHHKKLMQYTKYFIHVPAIFSSRHILETCSAVAPILRSIPLLGYTGTILGAFLVFNHLNRLV